MLNIKDKFTLIAYLTHLYLIHCYKMPEKVTLLRERIDLVEFKNDINKYLL